MKVYKISGHLILACFTIIALALLPVYAHAAVICGSTGTNGAFSPAADTTLTAGTFNYTTINIPAGVTVTINPATDPTVVAVMLARGTVTINGTLSVSGSAGGNGLASVTNTSVGKGGPGGFAGGQGGTPSGNNPSYGGPGLGPFSGNGYAYGGYGATAIFNTFNSLMPMIGGSGGGGGGSYNTNPLIPSSSGGAGGGGGGGLVVCSGSTIVGSITIAGTISAKGGNGGNGLNSSFGGGGGGGGTVRLIADAITGVGTITALGGLGGTNGTSTPVGYPIGTVGANGLIRFECFSCAFTGSTVSSPSPAMAQPAPVFPAPIPTLRIVSIGGATVPFSPTASLTIPDVPLSTAVVNPVAVRVDATNIPVGTQIYVYNYSASNNGYRLSHGGGNLGGTVPSSTVTVSGNLPTGISILTAETGSFTVTASLVPYLPNVNGEEIKEMYAKGYSGGETELVGVTGSGKEVPLIVKGDQILLASNAGLPKMQ